MQRGLKFLEVHEQASGLMLSLLPLLLLWAFSSFGFAELEGAIIQSSHHSSWPNHGQHKHDWPYESPGNECEFDEEYETDDESTHFRSTDRRLQVSILEQNKSALCFERFETLNFSSRSGRGPPKI